MKKILIFVLLLTLTFSYFPEKTKAQYVVLDPAQQTKEWGLDSVAYIAAKTIIRKLTTKTVNWINNGFKGNPGYLKDPGQFFLDVGDDVASQFLSQAKISKICTPFQPQVRLALVKNYIDDTDNYACTLSILQNNYNAFTQNFAQGGWEGWFEITQNAQNNPYGAFLEAQKELSAQVSLGQKNYSKEIDLSGGFLNLKRCPKGEETYIGAQKYCKVKEETVTPGDIISDQINTALGSKWGELVAADEFNEIITALVSQLVEQVAGSASGLLGASEKITTPSGAVQPSLVDQIGSEAQPYVNYQITGTSGGFECTSTGGGTDQYGNTTGGTTDCQSTPGSISGLPTWPLGSGGSGGSSCPAYTPNPAHDCTKVDSGAVLSILEQHVPDNAGITAAEAQVKGLYPWAMVLPHARLDKFDFGNGMVVDVIIGARANGPGSGWTWNVECACNRNPSGSPATNPPIPLPGTGTYTLTVDVGIGGKVTDMDGDACNNFSNSGTPTVSCSKPYPIDSFVSLTVTPDVGKTFVGWTGPCSVFGTSKTCQGNITANGTVGAIFQ
ncbi:MAG: hypothetical protein AB198_02510 [Parcubacteria bacterium C7867-003]|nr:MAG: hypothetical protein AB198_02510 [Parcubacteria bacterium C7867-003]